MPRVTAGAAECVAVALVRSGLSALVSLRRRWDMFLLWWKQGKIMDARVNNNETLCHHGATNTNSYKTQNAVPQ